MSIKAGVGKAQIRLTADFFPIEQFRRVHDPLFVRLVLIQARESLVFVSLDLTSLQDYAISAIKAQIRQAYPIPEDNIFVSVSHTFSAPHTRSKARLQQADPVLRQKNDDYLALILAALGSSLEQALSHLQSVLLSAGYAQADVNINRDIETSDGYWLGQNSQGFSNKTIPTLSLKSLDKRLLAVIYSVDVQSSIVEQLHDGSVSSDLVGRTSQKLEEYFENSVALFMLGAAADQAPRLTKVGYEQLEASAKKLAEALIHQLSQEQECFDTINIKLETVRLRVSGQELPARKSLKPVRAYSFIPAPDRLVEIKVLSIATIVFVMLKPELVSRSGHYIRQHSPYPVTFVTTMVNGAQKYMADEGSYHRLTYEAMNSMFAPGSAEQVCQAVIENLQKGPKLC